MENENEIAFLVLLGCFAMCLLVLAIIAFVVMHQKRMLKKEIQIKEIESRKQLELFQATVNAEERQKELISRNLHDMIGSTLMKLQIAVGAKSDARNTGFDSDLSPELLIKQTIDTIREACYDLVPHTLRLQGLFKAIEEICYDIRKTTKLKVKFSCFLDTSAVIALSEYSQANILRIVQELLRNVLKHSGATQISVAVKVSSAQLEIAIENDGIGIDRSDIEKLSEKGLGLNSISARITLLNGKVEYRKGKLNSSILSVPNE